MSEYTMCVIFFLTLKVSQSGPRYVRASLRRLLVHTNKERSLQVEPFPETSFPLKDNKVFKYNSNCFIPLNPKKIQRLA